jgi:hypothetical protein
VAFVLIALFALNECFQVGFSQIWLEHERHHRIISDVRALDCQITAYKSGSRSFPDSLSALKYLPKDPWDHVYIYRNPGIHHKQAYDLFSRGEDGKADTPDDDWGE